MGVGGLEGVREQAEAGCRAGLPEQGEGVEHLRLEENPWGTEDK